MNEFTKHLFERIFSKVGWENRSPHPEDATMPILRSTVLTSLGLAGDRRIATEATTKFWDFFEHGKELAPDLRGAIYKMYEELVTANLTDYSVIANANDNNAYYKLRENYKNSDLNEERIRSLAAIGYVKDTGMIKQTMEWALKEVKAQDIAFVFASLASNLKGLELAFGFLETKFGEILKKFGSTGSDGTFFFPVQVLMSRVFSKFADSHKIERIKKIFEENNLFISYQRTYEQIIESIQISEKFLETNKEVALEVLGNIVSKDEL